VNVAQRTKWIQIETARSMLFVPGDRPERFAKAAGSGADGIIVDLEDSVAPRAKADARRNVASWLNEGHGCIVRLSSSDPKQLIDEIAAISSVHLQGVVLPKAESRAAVETVSGALPTATPIIVTIESAKGLLSAPAIAEADGVARLALGSVDLQADLGADVSVAEVAQPIRLQLTTASAAAGITAPLDGPEMNLVDAIHLSYEIKQATVAGFTGKLCIHPQQVAAVNDGFLPSAAAVTAALEVLDAADRRPAHGVFTLAGRVVDRPVVVSAVRTLTRAGHRLDSNSLERLGLGSEARRPRPVNEQIDS
jgi:citrate lyase subunit beta / citryl-CoA lyase